MNELEQKLAELKSQLEGSLDAKAKSAIESQINALKSQLDGIESLKKENETLKSDVATLKSNADKNQKAIDEMIANQKNFKGSNAPKTIAQDFGEKMNENEAKFKAFKEGNGKGFSIEMNTKAVGNMASATNLTGTYFVTPTVVPGVVPVGYEEVHLRNLLPVGATNSNLIRYVRDNGGEGGPAMVAEGGSKPQIDRDLQMYDAPVRKIATHFRIPEEMMDDIPYLQSFLTMIGLEELMVVEDTQILYGNGSGQNLSGLFTNATAFKGDAADVDAPNEFDVIRAARKQLRLVREGGPLVALISPEDYYQMTSRKDTTNNYLLLGGGNGIALQAPGAANGGLTVGGVRIEEHTSIVKGDFIVFQPRAAQIFDRTGTSVRLYDQDQDNAIKNLITIVIEKRLALAIYKPKGIVKGTFASAIIDIATPS